MLNEKVVELFNEQINKEFFSVYLYLDIFNYYKDEGLDGFSNWCQIQVQEERDHAMLVLQYMQNNNEKIVLEAIAKPDTKFSDLIGPAKATLAHGQYVTNLTHAIYKGAYNVKDLRTMQFLDRFVKEQGERETNAENTIKKIEPFGFDSKGSYLLDQELAGRVYAAPSLVLQTDRGNSTHRWESNLRLRLSSAGAFTAREQPKKGSAQQDKPFSSSSANRSEYQDVSFSRRRVFSVSSFEVLAIVDSLLPFTA